MVKFWTTVLPLLGALLSLPAHGATSGACADIMPAPGEAVSRPLVAEDLARLRDMGPVDPLGQDRRILAKSPDGRYIAFQMRRADPARNAYCLAMVVIDLKRGAMPHVVDSGGDLIRVTFDFREKAGFPTGTPQAITPIWSPDGQWFAFLKRTGGIIQVWRANADGSGSAPLTDEKEDVDAFAFRPDGKFLIFSTKSLRAARDAIEKEGLSGFHYDDRYAPAASAIPFPKVGTGTPVWTMELATGTQRQASDLDRAILKTGGPAQGPWFEARHPHWGRAWLDTSIPSIWPGQGRLAVSPIGRATQTCNAPACIGASRPWWTSKGRVRFIRREGWAEGSTAVYEWQPGQSSPRRLYLTDDVLADCVPGGLSLICLREGSLTPRRLERLDLDTGRRMLLFDPNPGFSALALGKVERLHLTNRFGIASIADLVLPVGYEPGQRYPLVVVQYSTRGFLRGGTGDEYPIQAFANRGYAVLSTGNPKSIGLLATTDFEEADRLNLKDFADRRSTLDAVEIGVQTAIDRGIADPARIGITGMSDGASTVIFALLHSKMFAAAAMSSCCFDSSLPARVGPAAAKSFYRIGYPKIVDRSYRAQVFWRTIALSWNAKNIGTPILLQLADDEYRSALETYTALREVNAPIDMFIFPAEHHVKWQPAHRLAVYRRSLNWFDYWLKDSSPPRSMQGVDVSHWEQLRRAQLSRDDPRSLP